MASILPVKNPFMNIHFQYSIGTADIHEGKICFSTSDISSNFETFIFDSVKEVYRIQYEKEEISTIPNSISILSLSPYKLLLVPNTQFTLVIDLTRTTCCNMYFILDGKEGILDRVYMLHRPKYGLVIEDVPMISKPNKDKIRSERREKHKKSLLEKHASEYAKIVIKNRETAISKLNR